MTDEQLKEQAKEQIKEQIRKDLPSLTEEQVDIVISYVLNVAANACRGVEIRVEKLGNEEVRRAMIRHLGRADAQTLSQLRAYHVENMEGIVKPDDVLGELIAGMAQNIEAIMMYAEHLRQKKESAASN